MSKTGSKWLDARDPFPEMELKLTTGETIKLPDATGKGYGVVLFYRGYW